MRIGMSRIALKALRHAAPIAAALALILVLAGDDSALDDDLQLVVPARISVDSSAVPVRARIYTHLRAADGPQIVTQAIVDVRLETPPPHTRVLARARLTQALGAVTDLEGRLSLPLAAQVDSPLQIVAQTTRNGHTLSVHGLIVIDASAASDALRDNVPEPRGLRALQQFAAGPVRTEPGERAPSYLAARVRGGVCVPEQRCQIVVHVGEPAAALRAEPNSALTPIAGAGSTPETLGVAELAVVTHGPEAELWLTALHSRNATANTGQRVAARSVRLPIAMAGLGAEANGVVFESSAQVRVHGLAADGGCIIDAFHAGYWRATGSLSACREPSVLPFELAPGLWRLQLRRDAFSTDTAAVVMVYVRRPEETPAQVASALAQASFRHAGGRDDAFVRGCQAEPEACTSSAAHAYLAALLEDGLMPLPQAQSGYADTLAQMRERHGDMRVIALIALALGGIGLALSVGRTGMTAAVRASHLLDDDPVRARSARLRSGVVVLASVLSLLLVFVVLSLYVLARGGY
jgi:hypothetical protein